jgi:hypothetical protein
VPPPRPRLVLLRASWIAAAVLWAAQSFADEPSEADRKSAAETFRTGSAAYQRGDFRAAALSFELSFRLAPHGAALYNAGLAWEAAGEKARGADSFQRALDSGQLDGTQRDDAETRLRTLSASLGLFSATGTEGTKITVAHVEGAEVPIVVHLSPGTHRLVVTLPDGRTEEHTIEIGAGTLLEETLSREAEPEVEPSPALPPKPKASDDDGSAGLSTAQWIGIVGIGAGAVGGGVGVALGATGMSARDDFDASGRTDLEARDNATSLRTWANVAIFSSIAVGGAGIALLVWGGGGDGETTARVTPRGLELSGSF